VTFKEVTLVTPNPNSIYVFQSESGQYRVWPPVLVVAKDATVMIRNFTRVTLSLKFPAASRICVTPDPIEPGGRGSFSAGVQGGYPYQVQTGDDLRAVAHSDPSIIVD
jgi:hypothetical protein